MPVRRSPLTERQVELIFHALSDPRRYAILKQIASHQCTACSTLRDCFPISAPTLSHHLKELHAAGLVDLEKQGKFVQVTFRRDTWQSWLEEMSALENPSHV